MKGSSLRSICRLFAFLFMGLASCGGDGGGDNPPPAFSIDPPGPVVVRKGETLQFNTDPAGLAVTWSVEGGSGNGSIAASSGLYTPPSTLPVDPQIVVQATLDGTNATALVELRTGDSLAFGAEEPVNDTTIVGFNVGGVHDFLAAREGSLQVDAAWASGDGVAPGEDLLFAQSLDLAPFGAERNLTDDLDTSRQLESLDTSADLNPGILYGEGNNIQFLFSADQGATFGAPVPVDPGPDSQNYADLAFDGLGNAHVSWVNDFFQVRYSRSNDNGVTWSDPPTLLTDESDARCSTGIAVSDDGETVHLCYAEGICGSGTDRGEGVIVVATSGDGGQSFPTRAEVPGSADSASCRVAIAPSGEVYVSYKKGDEVFLAKSANGGASFQGGTTVNTNPTNEDEFLYPYMAVDSLGNIDMVWISDPDDDGDRNSLRYARSVNGGTSFSPDIEIANAGGGTFIRAVGLVHDVSGRLHLTYTTNRQDPDPVNPPFEVDVFYLRAE
ncbi:MAG TPA: sialidase family protein [bacterium]|nr:sialidase family protein [bacterium]